MLQKRLFNAKSFDKQDPTANQKSSSKPQLSELGRSIVSPWLNIIIFLMVLVLLCSFLIVPTVLPLKGGLVSF